jgi:flagellar basal-body rod protein FlgG
MMKALYTAATGMTAQQHQIDTIANNLANVSTNGFKKTTVAFEDLVYQSRRTGEVSNDTQRPAQLEIGSGVRITATNRNFTTGTIVHTGNTFDVAISGRGFYTVETPAGEERYTRNGVFHVNQDRELVNQAGLLVSPGIEIPSDAMEIKIAEDGTIKAVYDVNRGEVTLGSLDLVDFGNPNGLRAMGGNLYMATPESGDPIAMEAEDGIFLMQGFVEGSNVDVAEELIAMIVAQRSFELTAKVVETADETMQVVNNLKR